MIKSSTRLGVGHFFFRNSGPGGCGLALQMFRVCVFPGASRPLAALRAAAVRDAVSVLHIASLEMYTDLCNFVGTATFTLI